jgi:acyl-CoA thioesterase FadM
VVFVVHRLEIDCRRPARLGDSLTVTQSRVRLVVAQQILRKDELIASARVTLACLDTRTRRPVVIPECVPGRNRRIGRSEMAAPLERPT